MSLLFVPLNGSMPGHLDLDFDLEDLDFKTLSTEAPSAESLEPSLSVSDDLSPSLSVSSDDIWKLSSDSRSDSSSPVPSSVVEYLQQAVEDMKDEEFDEDPLSWSSLLQLRNDCMWSGESSEVSLPIKTEFTSPVKETAAVTVKSEPIRAVKCEPLEPEETVVAVSCGPVLTAVAAAPGLAAAAGSPAASAAGARTGVRAQSSLLQKSEVSLLKSNNRSLLISSRTGGVSANTGSVSSPSPSTVVSSPVKNNVSERVKVPPSVMWGPGGLGNANTSASCFQRSSLESDGDSPRPYTPTSQSESDEDDDIHPGFKHCLDLGRILGMGHDLFDGESSEVASSLAAVSEFCDLDFGDETNLTEAAEQMCRPSTYSHAAETTARAKSNSRKAELASRREEIESSRHAFMSDHSYHLSKGAVKTEHLGVQTPSDSEEEIDVVSVGDKHCPRTSACPASTALPTNPSARDRQQLQLTVASAITAKGSGGRGGGGARAGDAGPARGRIPVRFTLGERTVSVRSVPLEASVSGYDGGAESSSSSDAGSSGPARGAGPGRKRGGGAGAGGSAGRGGAKRPRVQYQHRLQHHAPRGRGRRPRGADDAEPDPTEKRSLHNDMERQRRIDLRNLVDDLRKLVPDLKDNKRAAKVMILREAATYCRSLRDEGRSLVAESAALRRQQDRMMARLSVLRRDLAASRL